MAEYERNSEQQPHWGSGHMASQFEEYLNAMKHQVPPQTSTQKNP